MKIHQCEQGTLDWLKLHIGIPTAGGFDALVDSSFDYRTGEMPKTFLHKKLAESWRGKPLVDLGGSSFMMEQGMILESEAIPWWELETGRKTKRVGFITTDDGRVGCSPDALLANEDCGLEIKCPAPHVQVKYLLAGGVPKEYHAQVQVSLFVTGFPKWIFVSYRRSFPPLIVEVERDEEIMMKIANAVDRFHADFNLAKKRISQIAQ